MRRFALTLAGAAAAISVLVWAAVALSRAGAGQPRPCIDTRQIERLPPAPRVFVSAQLAGGMRTVLALRSAASGAMVRKLGSFGEQFTDNGLALSPDGREVYFTLIPPSHRSSNLLIERLDVPSGRRSLVADGWEPSLSPNGRLLAFISDHARSESVVVEDLVTRRTHAIDVDAFVGPGHVLAEMPPAWFSDSRTIALLVTLPATLTSSSARGAAQPSHAIRMVVVQVPRDHPLAADRVLVPGLSSDPEVLGDGGAPGTLVAASLARTGAVLDALRFSPGRAVVCRLLTVRGGLALGFDGSGRRLLYVLGSSRPALWRGTISTRGLFNARRLLRNADLGEVAW